MTVNGRTIGENCRDAEIEDEKVIRRFDRPLVADAGFIVLKGNLFDAAIMKTSVIGDEFRTRYLSNPDDPDAFEGPARSEEHTSELQSLMRISYAVFCLKKNTQI